VHDYGCENGCESGYANHQARGFYHPNAHANVLYPLKAPVPLSDHQSALAETQHGDGVH
jgi:hypothetical protein